MGCRIGSGRMVMQAAGDFLVGGSNPSEVRPIRQQHRRRRPPTRIRTADLQFCGWVCYHSTRGGCDTTVSPIAWSLLSENF